MTQTNFQIAFSVEVLHSYFEKNICRCLQFQPGKITKKLIKRFALASNNKVNGFGFYINTNENLPAYLQYISSVTGETYFDFNIINHNSSFIYFTELPANQIGQLVYDSQSALNIYEEGTVQLNGQLSANTAGRNIGSLIIRFADIVKFRGDNGNAQFDIRFKARSTQWQYYVINKNSISLDNPTISKADIPFSGPENVMTETGHPAMLFSSGTYLIPLSEKPKYKFDLINTPAISSDGVTQKKSSPKIIYKGLPNPDPSRIGMTKVNGQDQISSPMYIYV